MRAKAYREKMSASMRRSWASGKRRKRRTKAQLKADRFKNPWEPHEMAREHKERYENKQAQEQARSAREGGMIWSLAEHRYAHIRDMAEGPRPGMPQRHVDPSS